MKDNSITKEFIIELIYSIIDVHNQLNPDDLKLEKSLDTVLLGPMGNLDSLGFVNFLLEVEIIIKKNVFQTVCIVNEELFLDENGPYSNVRNLSEYIFKQIQ
tara:strand:- start:6049 stop:6354 length:306 start_codon:yes stop_codon:yes gene_type:complete